MVFASMLVSMAVAAARPTAEPSWRPQLKMAPTVPAKVGGQVRKMAIL